MGRDAEVVVFCLASRPRRHAGSRSFLCDSEVAERGRWIAACQPTRDTDGDGRIHVFSGDHGQKYGDALTLFVFLEGHRPLTVDELCEATPDDRMLAVAIGGPLVLLDTVTGERTNVAAAPKWSPTVSRVAFSRDGSTLLTLVDGELWSRELATGHTQRTPLPPGDFASPERGPGGAIFLRELPVDSDGDGNGLVTSCGCPRGCIPFRPGTCSSVREHSPSTPRTEANGRSCPPT